MSFNVSVGFAGVSVKMSFVFDLIAALTFSGFVQSTKLNSIPKSENITRAARLVPVERKSLR